MTEPAADAHFTTEMTNRVTPGMHAIEHAIGDGRVHRLAPDHG